MSCASAIAGRGIGAGIFCWLIMLIVVPSAFSGPASLSTINSYFGDAADRTVQAVDADRTARVEAWLVADWFGVPADGQPTAVMPTEATSIEQADNAPLVKRYLESLATESGQQIVASPEAQIGHISKSYGIDTDLFVAASTDRALAGGASRPSGASPLLRGGQFGSYWSPDAVKRVMGVDEDILDSVCVPEVAKPAPVSDFTRDLAVLFDESPQYGGRAYVAKRRLAAGVRRFLLVDNVDISPYSHRVALSLTSWMEDVERQMSELAGSKDFVSQWSQYVIAPLDYESRIRVLSVPGVDGGQSVADQVVQGASDADRLDRVTSPAVLGAIGMSINYGSDNTRGSAIGGGRHR